jgi:arabinofuranosyltransferase
MPHQKRRYDPVIIIIAVIFIIWSLVFVYNVAFIAIDGRWYVDLFDDAMISMRYAWNLAHGAGLVWNPGEYVEGYTNLLMTLFMSLVMVIVDDKRLAVLIIHFSGIGFMLGIAFTTRRIAEVISLNESAWHCRWLSRLSFTSALFYYPLAYWTLMGMETGMVTLLTLLAILETIKYSIKPRQRSLFLTAVYLGLAYLTRPDAAIAALLIFPFLFYETHKLKPSGIGLLHLLSAVGLFAIFIIGQLIFRWFYYHDLLPNTYYLKATGMPFFAKIQNGVGFIIPFVQTSLIALILMAVGLILNRSRDEATQRQKLLLVLVALAFLYYQIWVGGDAWPPYWRIITPAMMLILVLALQGIIKIVELVARKYPVDSIFQGMAVLGLTLLLLAVLNIDFWPELMLLTRPYEAKSNENHVNTAIAINHLTTPAATIGVSSAGTVPYYSDRFAIDFLGKSDKYIARLPPDLTGTAHYYKMLSLPGHNKYDLNYSIKTLRPTYVQIAGWGNQILDDWVEARYATVNYKGVKLYLRKDSEDVLWDIVDQLPASED